MPSTSRLDPFGSERSGERVGLSDGSAEQPDEADEQAEQPDEADEQPDDDDEPSGVPDFYARLGVATTATPDELRRAYHRLVKLWHPDRYAGAPDLLRARAERRMRQLNQAYHTLSDPEARTEYDRQREGRGTPVGDVINVFGQRTAAHVSPVDDPLDGHASANPNGAGQFFGMLAAILALALIGGAIGGASIGGVGALVIVLGIAGLLVASAFMMTDSPLAKWAFHTLESDPRGTPHQPQRPRKPTPQPEPPEPPEPPAQPSSDASDAAGGAPHVDPATFDALIAEALTAVPQRFDEYMCNVIVRAEQEPGAETLRQAGVPEGHTLLGLYHGVSLTRRGVGDVGPEVITIYRGPIERYCGGDLERIRRQVRATTLHEVAHHFGIDHDEMPEWVK